VYETSEVLQDVDFSPFLADAQDVHACFDDIEEADEGVGERFDEVCDTASTGYCEIFPDDSDMF
jgi:hypothetical protein